MPYSIVQPLSNLDLPRMSSRELADYQSWFREMIPVRIEEMRKAVSETDGFESWLPDLTPKSLEVLGDWFASQVASRKTSAEEQNELQAQLSFPIDISDEELTNRTFSLAFDVGMYLGEVVRETVSGAPWKQVNGDKKFADYGQMVIEGLDGPTPLNPVRIAVNLAYGISRGQQDGNRLVALHAYWTK